MTLKEMLRDRLHHRGVGDTVEHVIHAAGLDRFAPPDCRCDQRKDWLNDRFPYKDLNTE